MDNKDQKAGIEWHIHPSYGIDCQIEGISTTNPKYVTCRVCLEYLQEKTNQESH